MGVRQCPTPIRSVAPGRGFEPRLADPESAVLPLDDPGIFAAYMMMSHIRQPSYLTIGMSEAQGRPHPAGVAARESPIDSAGLTAPTIQVWTHVNGSSKTREDAR